MKNIARHIGKTVLAAAFFAISLIANGQSSKDFKYLNEPAAEEGKAEEMAAEKKDSAKQDDDHFDGTICTEAETQPSFPGGTKAMWDYISKNFRYPKECMEKGIQGKVYVNFIVDTEGRIHNVEVVRSAHEMLDAEAVRLIKGMPAWIPAKQNGKNVNSEFMLPVFFKLVS